MTRAKDVEHDLMHYFAAVGEPASRMFSIRDFNTHVMMNAYSPEDRAGLHLALAALAEAGIVVATSPTDYRLTPEGLRRVRALSQARRAAVFPARRVNAG